MAKKQHATDGEWDSDEPKESDIVHAVKVFCNGLASDEERINFLEQVFSNANVRRRQQDNVRLHKYLYELRMKALFDFNVREIIGNCDKLPTYEDQKIYSSYVIREAALEERWRVVKAIKADLFHRTNVASASQNAAAGNPVISMKGRPRGNGNLSNVSAELLVHVLAYLILEKQERNQSPPRQYDLVGHFQVSRSPCFVTSKHLVLAGPISLHKQRK